MSFELARPEWLTLWVIIPLWWYWLRPRAGWGLLVARGQEATSISLRPWLGWLAENSPRVFRALAVALLIVALAEWFFQETDSSLACSILSFLFE